MPKQEQVIMLSGIDKETALAISYQAFQDLGWNVLFAGEEKILGQTIKKWNSNPQQVIVASDGHILNVSSEMTKGETFDISGKNKKNIAAFLTAFEVAKNKTGQQTIDANKNAIHLVREHTMVANAQQQKEAEEVDKAMNISSSNLYATYTIIGLNVLVFILMIMDGAGIMEANGLVHIKWGSNYSPLTLSGDWWRLITNTFIHFGFIHILMNMYCLYTIGVYLEPMLGKVRYITSYLCTGILASLVSLWWHKDGVNSAGASGAIFGMYGLFLALLTTDLIPKTVRKGLLQSIGIFVVYNLVYGVKSGVDNSAHVGGLVSGFIIGYLYVISLKKEKDGQKIQWVLPLIAAATIGIAALFLNSHKLSEEDRTQALNEVENSKHKDTDKYNTGLQEIDEIEKNALEPLKDSAALLDEAFKRKIENVSLPLYQKMEDKLNEMYQYDIAENVHSRTKALIEYVGLKRQELNILIKMCESGSSAELAPDLNKVKQRIDEILKKIRGDK